MFLVNILMLHVVIIYLANGRNACMLPYNAIKFTVTYAVIKTMFKNEVEVYWFPQKHNGA